jgi:Raf kinase inhibitor-like YbhB/YbcL family protein
LNACGIAPNVPRLSAKGDGMNITSASFRHGGAIPQRHSAYGENISPEIHLEGLTPGAKCWALIMDDPDAPRGTFTHWLLYNIPAKVKEIPEGAAPEGALVGTNDRTTTDYFGPRPPSGEHRYYFTAYALARKLDLPAGATREELEAAMAHHILDSATMFGRYAIGKPVAGAVATVPH